MSLKWIFVMLLMVYAVNAFSSVESFHHLINESTQAQRQLAFEIQKSLGIQKEKTLEQLTESDSVSLEGFNLKIY